LKRRIIESASQLKDDLILFQLWYNCIRPHQNLNGQTPDEAWNKTESNPKGKHFYFDAWDGGLAGVYILPA
jgi:hypothetical protein